MVLHQFAYGSAVKGHGDFGEIQFYIFFAVFDGRHNPFTKTTQSIEGNVFIFDFDQNCQSSLFIFCIGNFERIFRYKNPFLSCFLKTLIVKYASIS